MPELRPHPDLDQLRRQARELLRAADAGDLTALGRLARVGAPRSLAGAQLALAREHGLASWPKLAAEVARRRAQDPAFVLRRVRSPSEVRLLCAAVWSILGAPNGERPHWHLFDDFEVKRPAYLVIEQEGRVVGGAVAAHVLAVEAWGRGIGLGTRLLQTVEAELLEQGRPLHLHADPENRGFFLRCGYADRGRSGRHMYKGAPSGRLLQRRLRRWRDRAGDLDAGVALAVDPVTGKVPDLPW